MNTPVLPDDKGYWEYPDLKRIKDRCESYGLRLEALENVPRHFYDKAMLGLPGRDEQIENYQKTIRNMGKAGIPVLGYNWMPNWVWRTPDAIGRGGVRVTAFDMALADSAPLVAGLRKLDALEGRTIGADEMWANYAHFIRAVLPVAEEAGVKLAVHPDDPPVPELGGIARIFHSPDGFKRAFDEIAPSPNHGIEFCLGCFGEMGLDVLETIRFISASAEGFSTSICATCRAVSHKFQECFLGEGNFDRIDAVRTLRQVGFNGFIIDDHVRT
jgi:mannonate dehydratase